jgi:hypothetical protein
VAGPALTDLVTLGVLASRVPRDVVDDAVAATGKQARRRGGKLPPHVVVYLVMALALFAGEDYEEVVERLTGALRSWGSWDQRWEPPAKGAVTQARQRLGPEPMAELFSQVAEPVAGLEAEGAFLGPWRLMSVDGTEVDVPDTPANREAFGTGANDGPFPKVRLVTVCECGSRAPVLAAMGPSAAKGSGEQSLARTLYPRLEEGWLLLADRLFYGWDDWCVAAGSGADLLWRVRDDLGLPCLELLPDGSCRSVVMKASLRGARRDGLTGAARRGENLDPALARHVRVVEYEVTDRDGEDALITLVTTITGWQAAPAAVLAPAYHQRWQHETANAQVKTVRPARPRENPALRRPGPGPAGDLGLPPDRLGRQRPDQRRRRGRTVEAAEALDDSYPEQAARLWRALGLDIVNAGKSRQYAAAVEYFGRVQRRSAVAGLRDGWDQLVDRVRANHYRKAGFIRDSRRSSRV